MARSAQETMRKSAEPYKKLPAVVAGLRYVQHGTHLFARSGHHLEIERVRRHPLAWPVTGVPSINRPRTGSTKNRSALPNGDLYNII